MEMSVKERIASYEQQEERLRFEAFDNNTAWTIGSLIVEKAMKEGMVIATSIRIAGFEVFKFGLVGSNAEHDYWMTKKVNTVNQLKISSFHAAAILEEQQKTMEEYYGFDPEKYVCCGGGFPILLKNGELVGTIAVSGLPDNEDHQLMVDVLTDFLK